MDPDGRFQESKMRDGRRIQIFLDHNYLSSELRVPVTLLQTNACSPLATNAIGGNIWDNFSSQSYKDLPSVGTITWYHPTPANPEAYVMPAGGRGYTRPPSLVSLWSTAPFLLNNSVGEFNPDPSVKGRLQSFQNSIEQMLWPEKRDKDEVLGDKIPGKIDRTTERTYLKIADQLSSRPAATDRPAVPTVAGRWKPEDRTDSERYTCRSSDQSEPAFRKYRARQSVSTIKESTLIS